MENIWIYHGTEPIVSMVNFIHCHGLNHCQQQKQNNLSCLPTQQFDGLAAVKFDCDMYFLKLRAEIEVSEQ